MVAPQTVAPKRGDFIAWSDLIANALAPGDSADALRSYLKTTAKTTWQLVSALTHTRNSTRLDGEVAVNGTQTVLVAFSGAMLRRERGGMDTCPGCGSYRLTQHYEPELDIDPPYLTACQACGWVEPPTRTPTAE
jgi:hypothetical protein